MFCLAKQKKGWKEEKSKFSRILHFFNTVAFLASRPRIFAWESDLCYTQFCYLKDQISLPHFWPRKIWKSKFLFFFTDRFHYLAFTFLASKARTYVFWVGVSKFALLHLILFPYRPTFNIGSGSLWYKTTCTRKWYWHFDSISAFVIVIAKVIYT